MRTRLLVPGRLDVVVLDDGTGWIERGRLADIPPAVPAQEDLGAVALIPLEAAEPAPGSTLELDACPFVRAQLERLRWVLVDDEVGAAARQAGHPVLSVRGGRAGATWVVDGVERSFEAPDPLIWVDLLGDDPDPDIVHRWAETGSLQDRIVSAMTAGAVGLRDLELARWADALRPSTLAHEEAILAEIAERAVDQRAAVAALLAALDGDPQAPTVPVYGSAHRVVDPAFTLADHGGIRVRGGPIEVPEAVNYRVDGVVAWEPSAAGDRRAASFADWQERVHETRRKGKRRELMIWGGLGALLLLFLAVGLLGMLLSGWHGP